MVGNDVLDRAKSCCGSGGAIYDVLPYSQVIYPHTREEMVRRGKTDAALAQHLERVQLSYLLQREKGWDTVADWIDVLSGGEKQRIAVSYTFSLKVTFLVVYIYVLA